MTFSVGEFMNMKNKLKRIFTSNKSTDQSVMMQCRTLIDKSAVKRVNIEGIEHISITSKTLPDDVVMNGILYPSEVIEANFSTLERTLAPIEHPQDADGNYISANDPQAIHEFHAGAYNSNIRRENGRVIMDKLVNVVEAKKSEKGKRLLDRIEELETNDQARPIHTSVGVWVDIEEMAEPQVNNEGKEYTGIARTMTFDHDAILLDSIGAAQPSQGVGMAVNENGDKLVIQQTLLHDEPTTLSHTEIRNAIEKTLMSDYGDSYVNEIIGDSTIFWSNDQLFQAKFEMIGGEAKIVDAPFEVERSVMYNPKTNFIGDAMKDLLLNALNEAGIMTDGLDDAEIFAQYNTLQANQNSNDDGGNDDNTAEIAAVVANAVQPVIDKLVSLEMKVNKADEEEIRGMAELVGNSDKFPGVDVETATSFAPDVLAKMAANCRKSFGIPLTALNESSQQAPVVAMPE